MHTQNGSLRRVQDRRGDQGSENATVGDGEGTASHVLNGQLAVFGLAAELNNFLFNIGQAHGVGVTQNRDNQATVGGNSHAYVLVPVVNHIATIDGRVHHREPLQGFRCSFGEERHETKLDAVTFHKAVLVLLAHFHDRRHVHLVEGGQHGRSLLGINQTLGDAGTQASHGHTLLGALTLSNFQSRRSSRLGRRTSGRLVAIDVVLNVFFGYAAIFASAFHGCWVNTVLFSQLTGCRAQDGVAGGSSGFFLGRFGLGFLLAFRRLGFAGCAFLESADYFTALAGIAFTLEDFFNYAVSRSNHFEHDFVGFDVDNQLVTGAGFTGLLMPGRDGAFGNRLRENGGFNLCRHYKSLVR